MRLIAGSGRSGTTWILDSLAKANRLRPVFEPLHPQISETGKRYAYRLLAPDERHPELHQYLEKVSSGQSHALWTKYRQLRQWLFPPLEKLTSPRHAAQLCRRWQKFLKDVPSLAIAGSRRDPIVKCIRANLMLGWLSEQCECRIVLVVRHPGAVIESAMRGNWNAKFALNGFRSDPKFHELTGNRYRNLLERDLTGVEELAVLWVIENQWAIENATAQRVTVVFYEHLKSSPEREWQRICRALDLPNSPSAELTARPSQQSSPKFSAVVGDPATEPQWIRAFSRTEADQIQRVLHGVEFPIYSMSDPEPRDVPGERACREVAGPAR